MAIIASGVINRLANAGVPAFASPNPEGVAMCHIDIVGDGSGGQISGGIVSSGQFLYRLELFQIRANALSSDEVELFTLHDWATQSLGFGANSFDQLWHLERDSLAAFVTYALFERDFNMVHRFPLGSTQKVGVTNILFFQDISNIDLRVYDVNAVFTYWRKEALALPGFLQSFYDAPFVPGGVPLG